jgi:DNA-binding CsgD family transcriptional regulator
VTGGRAVTLGRAKLPGAAPADGDGLATFFGLQRTRRQGHVGPDEIALFERLLPHLRQAVSLGASLARLETRALALEDALHASGTAMILLDRGGRVAFTTAAAERVLTQRDGLLVDREGRLRAARPAESAALARLIGKAARTGAGGGLAAGGELALPRPSGKPPLLARISPMPLQGALPIRERIAVAMVLRDPAAPPRTPGHCLRDLFGLTRAEAALAAALAEGTRLPAYAEAAGITHETARWHLKRVLAKTETRSQSELAARLARLLA